MIFSSLQYLIFLPVVVWLYWRTRGGVRLALVVAASYLFYMSWLPVYGILLFTMTTLNWLIGLALGWAAGRSAGERKLLLGAGLMLNLGCLCYYKYTNFILTNLASAFNWLAGGMQAPVAPVWQFSAIDILLPLGISFFVFEFVHYLVDVYRGDKPVRSWMDFAAFSAFFPSQIAGPIKRYQDFLNRLHAPRPWSPALFNEAMRLIVQGLFKKVAIADPIASVISSGFAASQAIPAADAVICIVGFTIQVYCDFSGYTDIGRGSALLMGIRLPENFNLPFLSETLADFWRRWHMSLGLWLRDYVYIPLGGSRGGALYGARNLFLTMLACGVWHGAAWHYVIFGCLQGLGMVVDREWGRFNRKVSRLRLFSASTAGTAAGVAITYTFTALTFAVFRAPDMPHALNILASLLNFADCGEIGSLLLRTGVLQFTSIYFAVWLFNETVKRMRLTTLPVWSARDGFIPPIRLASWTCAAILMLAAKPIEATPFVYFQF